jgi:hypothetical protein
LLSRTSKPAAVARALSMPFDAARAQDRDDGPIVSKPAGIGKSFRWKSCFVGMPRRFDAL